MTDVSYYASIPPVDRFADAVNVASYRRLPDDWVVAVADVVGSTRALTEGRYKAVNMTGAASIAALMNEAGRIPFPFVFGGDGAAAALPGDLARNAAAALAETRVWAAEEMELDLRVGLIDVAEIRRAGRDVLVARYRPAPDVVYAMFAGGGVSFAEEALKAGRLDLPPAPPGARPDLTGLSCRWAPIGSEAGVILSVVAVPTEQVSSARFGQAVGAVLDLLASSPRNGHPVPLEGPEFRWPPEGLDYEVGARLPEVSAASARWHVRSTAFLAKVLDRTGLSFGGFNARRYRRITSRNSDFRKFDDGLRLTVDVEPATAEALERLLWRAERDGVLRYGLSHQDAALMTCIVPSHLSDDHMHFIDGAGGGYAAAAARLKARSGVQPA